MKFLLVPSDNRCFFLHLYKLKAIYLEVIINRLLPGFFLLITS